MSNFHQEDSGKKKGTSGRVKLARGVAIFLSILMVLSFVLMFIQSLSL